MKKEIIIKTKQNLSKCRNSQNGITLVALVVTIIVLLILAGISIGTAITLKKDSIKNKQLSELDIVQHAVLEHYTEYMTIKDESRIIGTAITWEEANQVITSINNETNNSISLKTANYDTDSTVELIEKYYKLDKTSLKQIGVTNTEDNVSYIVNYVTGEVIDELNKATYDKEPLYIYAVKNT